MADSDSGLDWLISTPAWGPRCVDAFLDSALPAMKMALRRVRGRARFVVHTDNWRKIAPALNGFEYYLPNVPPFAAKHESLGEANRQVLAMAHMGEAVAFVNADMVGSVELFEAAERRFAEGKRLVMMTGTRTVTDYAVPPVGAAARELLRWAWKNRHPWIDGCTWPTGAARASALLHFVQGDNVVLHGFHLHPFALLKEREITFPGITTDHDLADQFPREQIHVVTSADEAAFAEMTPADVDIGGNHRTPNTVKKIADWATSPNKTTPTHRWMWTHRIEVQGDGQDIGDAIVCAEILAEIEKERPRHPYAVAPERPPPVKRPISVKRVPLGRRRIMRPVR